MRTLISIDPNISVIDSFRPEGLDSRFSLIITAFTDVLITNITLLVDGLKRWPVVIFVSLPGLTFIVLSDWIGYFQALDGLFQILQISLILKFWVVVSDHHQSF